MKQCVFRNLNDVSVKYIYVKARVGYIYRYHKAFLFLRFNVSDENFMHQSSVVLALNGRCFDNRFLQIQI